MHSAPKFLREPGLDVGVVVADDGNPEAGLFDHLIRGKIGFSVVIADGIGSHEGGAGLDKALLNAVVHGMAGFNVVVAHSNGVVLHVLDKAREKMGRFCVNVVVVVCRIVSLKAVPCVYKKDVVHAVGLADAVYVVVHGKEGFLYATSYIGRVEPRAMDVVGGKDGKGVFPVFETALAGEQRK